MDRYKITGDIDKKGFKDLEITWNITDFSSITEGKRVISSPPFNFASVTWHIHLHLKPKRQNLRLYLIKNGTLEFSVKYSLYVFDFRKENGTVEYFDSGTMREKDLSDHCLINLFTVGQRISEKAPSDMLSIICRLKGETNFSREEEMLAHSNITKKLKKMDKLSENFKSLFRNKHGCDVTLHVMEKEYKAHKTVLMARSSVFASMFMHETTEKHIGVITISDCDSESFDKFLEFLYCGKLKEISLQNALALYETSHKYHVHDLEELCRDYLNDNLTLENLLDVVIIADKYDDSALSSVAQYFFSKNLKDVLVTSEWRSLIKNNYLLSQKLLEAMSSKVIDLQ